MTNKGIETQTCTNQAKIFIITEQFEKKMRVRLCIHLYDSMKIITKKR